MEKLLETLGRLHVAVLHLPIGLLLFATAWAFFQKEGRGRAFDWLLGAAAVSALATAATGWLLHREGGYDLDILARHQWLGWTAAAGAAMAFFFRQTEILRPALAASALLVAAAGHFGGSLTHGAGFLNGERSSTVSGEPTTSGVGRVASDSPITVDRSPFKKCVGCHGPTKQKGGLRLDSPEFIEKGGKHGPVVDRARPDSSLLLAVISLPPGDKRRMPPIDKPQLTSEELSVLKNWVLGRDLPAAQALPEKEAASDFPPVAVNVASPAVLEKIRSARLASVERLGGNWLSVSLAGKRALSSEMLDNLKKIGQQTAQLDAARVAVSSSDLRSLLGAMPNLVRLDLSGSALDATGAAAVSQLGFLKKLNLTGCRMGDGELRKLAEGLPALREIFLWKSGATTAGISFLKEKKPGLRVETGEPSGLDSLPELALGPPRIVFSRSIFDDTVQVRLEFGMPQIGIFYTTDGSEPSESSTRYDGRPLVFSKATRLRAIASRPGWKPSAAVEASFAQRKFRPKTARLVTPIDKRYPASGAASLIDGITGDNHYDKTWLGFEGKDLEAVLEFAETVEVARAGVHFMDYPFSWINAPAGLAAWASMDGKAWRPLFSQKYASPSRPADGAKMLSEAVGGGAAACRFLKIKVENRMKNPAWHPNPGKTCWVFVDEILVE